MNKFVLILFMGLALSCQDQKNSKKVKEDRQTGIRDSLTRELNQIHKLGFINGFSVAIVDQDSVLYQSGIGFSDMGNNTKYTENTIQNIGSVSKTLIGIALLKAQEMGKLNLDDPINQYLPFEVINPNYPKLPLTIRHLATHTSTILDTDFYNGKAYVLKDEQDRSSVNQEKLNEAFNPPDSRMPMIDFLEKLLSKEGEWYRKDGFATNKPGEIFEYSNVGATLAAAILEIAVDKPYSEFTKEHILEPLGMSSSGWTFDTIDLARHSKLYSDPKTEIPLYSLITYPDGGLITSGNNLGMYLSELIKGHSGIGTLLEKNGYEELFREQLSANSFPDRDEEDDYDDEYNTGIFMGFTPRGYIGHTGGDPGIATYMFFNPETKIGRLLMINTSVSNSAGVDEFYSIWNTLAKYENKLK
ncbi:serine hydrolase domain-containing protein [Ulvibacterium sp.]|uniref:serine hydrolase domain-containing protein n=1 Tax=Ulvibacterium sp. TaxID=2665914 RepID=UPI003BA91B92